MTLRVTKPGKGFSAIGSLVALLAACVMGGQAQAMTVTVDGVRQAGEYTGGVSHGSESLLWFNDHHSIYTEAAGNMNPLLWEINEAGGIYSLNAFFEVPTYARRMIWADGCKYKSSGTFDTDCAPLAPGGDTSYLDAYELGSHHDDVEMKYKTQTESEYFQLNGLGLKIKWQDEDNTKDDFTWATSREYLLDNGICTEDLCLQFEQTASIELMWLGLASEQAARDIIDSVTSMQLHLSDEARGLPPVNAVPVPAAVWLFGTALLGFIGISRRTRLS